MMEYPKAVKVALRHVIEHYPNVVGVLFYPHGEWHYFTADIDEKITFDNRIDVGILEEAADSLSGFPAMFDIYDPRFNGEDLWNCDEVQLPRVIAELEAAGVFEAINLETVLESMDLKQHQFMTLISRGQKYWDKHLEDMREN